MANLKVLEVLQIALKGPADELGAAVLELRSGRVQCFDQFVGDPGGDLVVDLVQPQRIYAGPETAAVGPDHIAGLHLCERRG